MTKFFRKLKRKFKKKKAGRKSFEFGKMLTAFIVAFFLINFEAIVVVSFILMFKFGDLTPLTELIMGTFAVVGTIVTGVVAFYQWKSKAENTIKIKKSLGMEITDKDISQKSSYWENEGFGGYGNYGGYDDFDSVG